MVLPPQNKPPEPIAVCTPEGARVTNHLYRSKNPAYLSQDLLTIALPNGFFVDVGWYPESDPNGNYVVRVFYQYWDYQMIRPLETRNGSEAARIAERLAEHYSSQQVSVARSTITTATLELTP